MILLDTWMILLDTCTCIVYYDSIRYIYMYSQLILITQRIMASYSSLPIYFPSPSSLLHFVSLYPSCPFQYTNQYLIYILVRSTKSIKDIRDLLKLISAVLRFLLHW